MNPDQALDHLCTQCQRIFARPLLESTLSRDRHAHHQTCTELRDAVLSKCWICSKLWRYLECVATEISLETLPKIRLSWILEFEHDDEDACLFLVLKADIGGCIHTVDFIVSGINADPVITTSKYTDFAANTSSIEGLARARGWVERCVSHHNKCDTGGDQAPYVPSRLVYISAKGDEWRVVSDRDLVNETTTTPPRYIALSYMWGQHQPLTLQISNLAQLRHGLAISVLPQTFRDLIKVARVLGVEYIWIDALCIIQDSLEDWHFESMHMKNVYANAYCTIAASWGTDPTKGLFTDRDVCSIPYGAFRTGWAGGRKRSDPDLVRIYLGHDWDDVIQKSPLHKRGWAFQERLLSARILYYTPHQILFECNTQQLYTGFWWDTPRCFVAGAQYRIQSWHGRRQHKKSANMNSEILAAWFEGVQQYSLCDLTKETDRLIALQGVIDAFGQISGDENVFGLWLSKIWECLLWLKPEPVASRTNPSAPSFSWASTLSQVEYNLVVEMDEVYYPFSLEGYDRISTLAIRSFAPMHTPGCLTPFLEFLDTELAIDVSWDDKSLWVSEHTQHTLYFLLLLFRDWTCEKRHVNHGHFSTADWSPRHLAAFGLYEDENLDIHPLEDAKEIDFILS